MSLLQGCAVCFATGVIAVGFAFHRGREEEFAGTVTYEWFAPGTPRETAREMFERAVSGTVAGPRVLRLDPAKVSADLVSFAKYLPTGVPQLPVLGVFAGFPAEVLRLTCRERAVAKLVAEGQGLAQISESLGMCQRLVTQTRHSLAERLHAHGHELDHVLRALREVL